MYRRLCDVEEDIRRAAARYGLRHLLGVEISVLYNPASRSRAVARIWGLGRIFQVAFGLRPGYVIELLPPFARLRCEDRLRAVAHELAHVPDTASGSLRPHNKAFWRTYRSYLRLFKCDDFPSLTYV